MKKRTIALFWTVIIVFLFESCHNASLKEYSDKILINEIVTQNTRTAYDKDWYKFSDYIELFNPTNSNLNLSGYTIIGGKKNKKYIFADTVVIPAHAYLLLWADEKNLHKKDIHLNFKLPSDGGVITLISPKGKIVDRMQYEAQKRDISFGKSSSRQIDGYMIPTPGSKNSVAFDTLRQTQKPLFSLESGFYDAPIVLSFENTSKNRVIYYTLDGSMPSKESLRYEEPIVIEKTTVVSAVAYGNNALASDRVNKSYFINEHTSLSVISMIIEPRFLYDDEIGIYTVGTNGADVFSWCGGPKKANYFQDWERAAYFEYFKKDKSIGFSLLAGVKVAGFCTQVLPQKSFTVKMKDKYGQKSLYYKLFKDREINKFNYFSLRNAGNDWCNAMLRDAFMQRSCEVMRDLSPQAYQPTLLFINGKYWGIYNIREKINETYLQTHYGVKKVDLLENNMTIKAGSAKEYSNLLHFIKNNNLKDDLNYEYVRSKIDIDQFIDYYISEIYFANNDWPGNNILYWKDQESKSAKWRWILHDTDFGFDLQHKNGISFNMLDMVTSNSGSFWPNPPWSTFLLRNLLDNDTFKEHFIKRSMMQLDNVFESERMKTLLEKMAYGIAPEIQRQYDRWSSVDMPEDIRKKYPTFTSIEEWYAEIERMKDFADHRNCFVKKHFGEMFHFSTPSCKGK